MPTHKNVPPELWGRDHVSTFAYAMSRIFGNGGKIERTKMRVGPHHPGLEHVPTAMRMEHPTRLADGSVRYGHDDYDCIDDLVAAGLFKYVGTGMNPGVVSDPSPEALDWAQRIAAVEAAGGRWSAVEFNNTKKEGV